MSLYFFDPISSTIHYHNRDIELPATAVLEGESYDDGSIPSSALLQLNDGSENPCL